ncbi:hypothetical protein ETD83_28280 [Actinomadura soli]|uniref:Uncharacterized protein n=1 Tax=Actinomadura soli TaxID=2508997 RepID=A0A5C4J629_9ACTN|nr:hypothetical protein [Actinomadura soli]TMQ92024.1 hypothetical protein ETD83_28280 [Actinomadura soli]
MPHDAGRWLPVDVCGALVEEAIRESLKGRFFKGTVEMTVIGVRRRFAELLDELDQTDAGHDGPVKPECPIRCLGLPGRVHNPLTSFWTWNDTIPPRTVAEVLRLAEAGQLDGAKGIGPALVREIEDALQRAGFPVEHDDEHHHVPPHEE